MIRPILIFLILFFSKAAQSSNDKANILLKKGWDELVKDNDSLALQYFTKAYYEGRQNNDIHAMAEALLNCGIVNYSVSYSDGMDYAMKSMSYYKQLEVSAPDLAIQGRGKCLQLIATIYSRQGRYEDALNTSREALNSFPSSGDTTGTLGLIYQLFGSLYKKLGETDSASYYVSKALEEREITKNYIYMPSSILAAAELLLQKDADKSLALINRALFISDSMQNRQSIVSSLLCLHRWNTIHLKNTNDSILNVAYSIAKQLRDKSFEAKTINAITEFYTSRSDFKSAFEWQKKSAELTESLNSYSNMRLQNIMEARFRISEYERNLDLIKKESRIHQLKIYLLTAILLFAVIISALIIRYQIAINKRRKQLLLAKEELYNVLEAQKILTENELNNELEFRQDQLHAIGLQLRQKKEVLQELKDAIDSSKDPEMNQHLKSILRKGQFMENDWEDFNQWFEGVNKNFYQRLKSAYPDISLNDLRLCALIRLNLSSKSMAGILNINPESVKTARYRLRKKLQLKPDDNLTEFILNL